MKSWSRLTPVLLFAIFVGLVSSTPRAQSSLASADVKAMLGNWGLVLDGPMGPVNMSLALKDDGGKAAAELAGAEFAPGKVTEIAKTGNDLILFFSIDAQGMTMATKLTLTPDGEKLKAAWDIGPGMFQMPGTGTKK
jgi:hypothetical protein